MFFFLLLNLIIFVFVLKMVKYLQYAIAEVQLRLHQEYDNYLASGELDTCIYESVSSEV